jgi:hypothetical protein
MLLRAMMIPIVDSRSMKMMSPALAVTWVSAQFSAFE